MLWARVLIALWLPVAVAAQPTISAVLNGASYTENFSPGCWIVIFGKELASTSVSAATLPLPERLGGTLVTVGGFSSHLLYVSPTQVNAVIPFEVPASGSTRVPVVLDNGGATASYSIYVNRNSPALFTLNAAGTGRALVLDTSYRPTDILNEGDIVTLYATGLGATTPTGRSDSGATVASPVVDEVEAFLGDQEAEVLYAGLAPGFPGIYQVNVRVPVLWTDRLYLRQRGWLSNVTSVGRPERFNADHIVATIEPVLPRPTASVTWSLPLFAANATVDLDLRPGAQPFVIAAVAGGGGSFTRVDPANGMLEEYWTTPTAFGDFSSLLPISTVMDFTQGCQPFPGNVVPASRFDPATMSYVHYSLPPPMFSFPGFAAGSNLDRWHLIPGSPIHLHTRFGDFLQAPCGSQKTGTMTFAIYVDGKLITSQDVVYQIAGR